MRAFNVLLSSAVVGALCLSVAAQQTPPAQDTPPAQGQGRGPGMGPRTMLPPEN